MPELNAFSHKDFCGHQLGDFSLWSLAAYRVDKTVTGQQCPPAAHHPVLVHYGLERNLPSTASSAGIVAGWVGEAPQPQE
jgi:hypothetical protein